MKIRVAVIASGCAGFALAMVEPTEALAGQHVAAARPVATPANVTVYEGASVWNGSDFQRRDIAISGGKLVNPRNRKVARRIDVGGRFIVPAYANAHAHLTAPTPAASAAYLKNGVFYVANPNTVTIGPEGKAFFKRPETYDVLVAQGGITEPRGHPEKLYVEYLAKPVYGGKPREWFIGNAFHYGRTPTEIDLALDRLKKQGADFAKIYLLYSEEYQQRRDDDRYYGLKGLNPVNIPYLVKSAHRRGLRVAAHLETANDLRVAAEAGVDIAAHIPGYWRIETKADLNKRKLTPEIAALVARKGMVLVPTYSLGTRGDPNNQAPELSQQQVDDLQSANLALLIEAGAKFMIGTDGPGPINDEVERLVALGVPAKLALQWLFATGPKLFTGRKLGCLAVGCEADFLVLQRNPAADVKALRSIEGWVKAGQPAVVEAPSDQPK